MLHALAAHLSSAYVPTLLAALQWARVAAPQGGGGEAPRRERAAHRRRSTSGAVSVTAAVVATFPREAATLAQRWQMRCRTSICRCNSCSGRIVVDCSHYKIAAGGVPDTWVRGLAAVLEARTQNRSGTYLRHAQ